LLAGLIIKWVEPGLEENPAKLAKIPEDLFPDCVVSRRDPSIMLFTPLHLLFEVLDPLWDRLEFDKLADVVVLRNKLALPPFVIADFRIVKDLAVVVLIHRLEEHLVILKSELLIIELFVGDVSQRQLLICFDF